MSNVVPTQEARSISLRKANTVEALIIGHPPQLELVTYGMLCKYSELPLRRASSGPAVVVRLVERFINEK